MIAAADPVTSGWIVGGKGNGSRHPRTFLLLLPCPASGSIMCTAEGQTRGIVLNMDSSVSPGEQHLERPLCLHLLSPVVRVQSVR